MSRAKKFLPMLLLLPLPLLAHLLVRLTDLIGLKVEVDFPNGAEEKYYFTFCHYTDGQMYVTAYTYMYVCKLT